MIIWSGLGILIPLFWIAGFVGAGFVTAAFKLGDGVGVALQAWAGAAMVVVFAKTAGRREERVLLDPATGAPVRLARKHTLFFLEGMVWAVFAFIVAGMVTVFALGPDKADKTSSKPGEDAFKTAEHNTSSNRGQFAFGNTTDAKKLAAAFSQGMKDFREIAISGTDSKSGLSKGEFLTHCQLTSSGCVFVVHVPGLRNYQDTAKNAIKRAAWDLSQTLASSLKPKPAALAVAIRGVVLFESIWIGTPAEVADAKLEAGVERKLSGTDKDALYPLFASAKGQVPKIADQEESNAASDSPVDSKKALDATKPDGSIKTESSPPPKTTPVQGKREASSRIVTTSALPTPERDWKASDGRPLRAALIRVISEGEPAGVFRRADGQEFTIKIDKFSAEDQSLIRSHLAPSK